MRIDARFVGTALEAVTAAVDPRRSMNYAAAVGDDNPRYFDDERPDGIIAPPMLAVALTWPLAAGVAPSIAKAGFPLEALATLVHHTEHLQFHRPIRPGETLAIAGAVAAIGPHRAGTRIVLRFEARDAAGSPVFTEHLGGLLRGVGCAGGGAGLERLPAAPDPAGGGSPLWEAPIPVDRLRPFLYDAGSGIVFPIHTSRRSARQAGLPDIILQGTATLALAARELTDREAGGEPARLKALAARFGAMVFPGSAIRVRLNGRRDDEAGADLWFEVANHQGEPAIRRGYARLESERA
jgi:acyl dehydratase